ncbi:YCF48-related protein [Salicola sp. Rm-C-2C1-2]|uniref:WD40/YVTN/BNR-like repeat-containing protein n=1 Tax=Salicola sp. Rm-C-2C1-2 TaxID=3141321 RepID=UPI0032E3A8F9
MFSRTRKRIVGIGMTAAIAAGGVGSAHAERDILEIPALDTDLAAESLLLDVEHLGDRLVAVGERGHIVYSDDGGKSWTQAEVPVSATLTGVDFPEGNASEGWAVGHSGVILHSGDGGETWEHQFDGREGIPKLVTQYEQRIDAQKAEIEAAEDEGRISDLKWELDDLIYARDILQEDLKKFGPWQPMLDVWFRDADYGIAVGAYNLIYRTEDGGETWQPISDSIDNPNRFHLNEITQVEGGELYIAGESGFVYRSTDEGRTWETLEPGYPGSFFGVVGTGDGGVLAFGLRGNVYRSQNGDEWKSVDSSSDRTLNAGDVNDEGEIVIVANDGAVIYSSDGGQSFSEHVRPARHSYVGVTQVPDNGLVLVGENGAVLTDRRGKGQEEDPLMAPEPD